MGQRAGSRLWVPAVQEFVPRCADEAGRQCRVDEAVRGRLAESAQVVVRRCPCRQVVEDAQAGQRVDARGGRAARWLRRTTRSRGRSDLLPRGRR